MTHVQAKRMTPEACRHARDTPPDVAEEGRSPARNAAERGGTGFSLTVDVSSGIQENHTPPKPGDVFRIGRASLIKSLTIRLFPASSIHVNCSACYASFSS